MAEWQGPGFLSEDLDLSGISEGGLLRLRQSWRDWRGGSKGAQRRPATVPRSTPAWCPAFLWRASAALGQCSLCCYGPALEIMRDFERVRAQAGILPKNLQLKLRRGVQHFRGGLAPLWANALFCLRSGSRN